jgi:hypothetical protein
VSAAQSHADDEIGVIHTEGWPPDAEASEILEDVQIALRNWAMRSMPDFGEGQRPGHERLLVDILCRLEDRFGVKR